MLLLSFETLIDTLIETLTDTLTETLTDTLTDTLIEKRALNVLLGALNVLLGALNVFCSKMSPHIVSISTFLKPSSDPKFIIENDGRAHF